jgi:hypothetical protein
LDDGTEKELRLKQMQIDRLSGILAEYTECPVCLGIMAGTLELVRARIRTLSDPQASEASVIPCGHIFCKSCIGKSNGSCAICRTLFSTSSPAYVLQNMVAAIQSTADKEGE